MKTGEAAALRAAMLATIRGRLDGAIDHALSVHGEAPGDILRATALVAEEAGEAIKSALDATRTNIDVRAHAHELALANLKHELAQTAAMAIMVLYSLEGR